MMLGPIECKTYSCIECEKRDDMWCNELNCCLDIWLHPKANCPYLIHVVDTDCGGDDTMTSDIIHDMICGSSPLCNYYTKHPDEHMPGYCQIKIRNKTPMPYCLSGFDEDCELIDITGAKCMGRDPDEN